MKRIKVGPKLFALVDDEDYGWLNQYGWSAFKATRGGRHYIKQKNNSNTIYIHRFIMNGSVGQIIDHINGNPLDNQKKNLRICTQRQNSANRVKAKSNTSGYKGVSWNKKARKWEGHITVNYRKHYLGLYLERKEAVKAYNQAASRYYGEYAKLNFL